MKKYKMKKHPAPLKKFAPKIIGNERAKILSDSEMVRMHKSAGKGLMGKQTSADSIPRGVMMFKDREA